MVDVDPDRKVCSMASWWNRFGAGTQTQGFELGGDFFEKTSQFFAFNVSGFSYGGVWRQAHG
ncbi:hypothetical protein skT53_24590 [Effusibacillus dendaii]|uniref:Uncharacterized protein n=1 Tax=Effusibacillus dendaii TaxID=2743772 RepID=A0A7I8DBM1_9BACL|nr:hypothetical protein skT53_24590 [Effusibacillus dendaii]